MTIATVLENSLRFQVSLDLQPDILGSFYYGIADLGVKMEKNFGVIKGRFYVTTSLSDSWEAFTPLHAGVTLGRFLH